MVYEKDLKTYMNRSRIKELKPDTNVPFAVLMGADMFSQYVSGHVV
jgi:hypothetical protein